MGARGVLTLLFCMWGTGLIGERVSGVFAREKAKRLNVGSPERGSLSPLRVGRTKGGFIRCIVGGKERKNLHERVDFPRGSNPTRVRETSLFFSEYPQGVSPSCVWTNDHVGITLRGSPNRSEMNIPRRVHRNRGISSTCQMRGERSSFFRLGAKMPVITVNRKLFPKEYSTDYEEILRKFDVTYINYKTRLRSKEEIDIRAIDDLYGQIYDSSVLKKQFYFFLYHDDINTCHRVLNENRNVLTREESFQMLNSLPYIFFNHLNYVYPTESNVDRVLSQLVKTYIFQYANDRNVDFLNFKYKYNELDDYCLALERQFLAGGSGGEVSGGDGSGEVTSGEDSHTTDGSSGEDTNMATAKVATAKVATAKGAHAKVGATKGADSIYDDGRDTNYERKYRHMSYDYKIIESTSKYRELMERFGKYPQSVKLQKVQLLYTKIISMKANKLFEAFRKHESVKRNEERKIYRNAKMTLDPEKLTPCLNEPIRYDPKEKQRVNELFHKYVEQKDLIKAALIIRKHTNLIDTKEKKSQQIMKEFLRLHEYIYKCNKYSEEQLAHLRMVYYSTVQKPRVIRKICEVGMWEQGENATHKEVYERQLNEYLKKREALRDERMKKKNIDMDQIRDFSSAYPMEWLPVLYKDMFEQIEREKNSKTFERKSAFSKRRDSIRRLFSPGGEPREGQRGKEVTHEGQKSKDVTHEEQRGRDVTHEEQRSKDVTHEEQRSKDVTHDQQRGKDPTHDLLNVKNELKFGRNVLNYKKKILGKNRRKRAEASKGGASGGGKSAKGSGDATEGDS